MRGDSRTVGAVGAVGLALAATAAGAWGPTGQVIQPVPIVTRTDMLRAIAQVHPAAADVLSAFQPGRAAGDGPTIAFGRLRYAKLPTAALVELSMRGVHDAVAIDDAMKPLPEAGEFVETAWHSAWTGAGDLDVTFDTRIATAAGSTIGTAFPALTVQIARGDPAIVKDWHPATAQEMALPRVQGPPAPVPNQMILRVPVRLEPLSAIKAYSQAYVRQDLGTVVAMTSHVLADGLGGPDQLLAWWQQKLVTGRTLHQWPTAEQINDVRPLAAPGLDLYVVQATRWFEDWPRPRGRSYVYLLDTPDKGRHWEVLDLACTGLRWLHAVAPGFKEDAQVADLLPDDLGHADPRSRCPPPPEGATGAAPGLPSSSPR
ncbi:MAG TPA: hypothetical protein VH328_11445 [Burkholderiaceae bacterium]|nr:hypothetical protein [Burkholderiaceae bacterium]